MKVKVEANEMYPVLTIDLRDLRFSTEIDVPEEKVIEWRKIHSAWLKAQDEIKAEVSKARDIPEVDIHDDLH